MDVKKEAWDKFLDAMDFESDVNNFKYDFKIMTKKYGNAFIEFLKASWIANDGIMTDIEFCKINANIPIGFFNKVVNRMP